MATVEETLFVSLCGSPVLQSQPRDALELTFVVRHQSQFTGDGLCRDQSVERSYGRAGMFQSGPNRCIRDRIVRGELEYHQWPQEMFELPSGDWSSSARGCNGSISESHQNLQ